MLTADKEQRVLVRLSPMRFGQRFVKNIFNVLQHASDPEAQVHIVSRALSFFNGYMALGSEKAEGHSSLVGEFRKSRSYRKESKQEKLWPVLHMKSSALHYTCAAYSYQPKPPQSVRCI